VKKIAQLIAQKINRQRKNRKKNREKKMKREDKAEFEKYGYTQLSTNSRIMYMKLRFLIGQKKEYSFESTS